MPAEGGVSPRKAAIAQYSSSPKTRPAEGGVSPRRATIVSNRLWGVGCVWGGVVRDARRRRRIPKESRYSIVL